MVLRHSQSPNICFVKFNFELFALTVVISTESIIH